MLVELDHATALAADRAVLSGISLTVNSGDRLGVVGINGTGKSTLLSILAGTRVVDDGVIRRGRGATLHALDQHPDLGHGTVRDVVGSGWRVDAASIASAFRTSSISPSPPCQEDRPSASPWRPPPQKRWTC